MPLRWLEGSDVAARFRWAKRAEDLGLTLPAAATAPHNLVQWVPAVAGLIVREERLQ